MKIIKKILMQVINYIDGLLFLCAAILVDVTAYMHSITAGNVTTAITLIIIALLIDIGAYLNGGR